MNLAERKPLGNRITAVSVATLRDRFGKRASIEKEIHHKDTKDTKKARKP